MRRWRFLVQSVVLALAVSAGCKHAEPELKPPPHPEEFNLPPEDEARFTKPMTFPEGTPKSAKLNRNTGGMTPLSDPTRLRGTRPGASTLY